ncbi:MAG TPA: HD domain-containing protein [Polyangiaceae bacterium]|nr:HD domain-containing protein [Polyangiaceae bacterium]
MILRDPVHGLVSFEADEERIVERLMDTPEVQRLRRVRQLGVTSFAFPGAEHTRFAHAVGAAFVMKLLLARLRSIHGELPYWQQITSDRARDALAAAMLHDVGHGPLSHLFEDAIPGVPEHEEWTRRVVLDPGTAVHRVLAAEDPAMPGRVAALVSGEHPLPYRARSVSGTFDVDRCDYLLRDAHATGVRYGVFDLDWLLRSLRFAPSESKDEAPALAIDGAKGLPAIEAFLIARLFMFQQVYLHKATRAAEWMIRAILSRAARLIAEGARIEGTPRALELASHGNDLPLGEYLELDDAALTVAMHAWERSKDEPLADLARRIRVRALFKTYELFGENANAAGRARALATARDVARSAGLDPEVHVGLDVASDVPFEADKEPLVVYSKGKSRPLSEVSFLLSRLKGETLERVRLVFAPELREAITAAVSGSEDASSD